jgi:hypothetical protein
MQNNLCPHCDGRGFFWHKELLLSRNNQATVLADIYSQGPICNECNGTGHATSPRARKLFFLTYGTLAALLLSAFVIMPLIKAWLDNVGP